MSWPDLFVSKQFFDQRACEAIVAEMKAAAGGAATVYGSTVSGAVNESVRRTFRVKPSNETVSLVTRQLLEVKESIEKHFDVGLNECEDPQFLRYREGDFFVAHQDGNTGLLRIETEKRRISTVIFLNSDFGGGSLVFSSLRDRFVAPAEPGMLVAFRSETTHEVTPVTHGERYSIASWYR